jgi:hypothetical protein
MPTRELEQSLDVAMAMVASARGEVADASGGLHSREDTRIYAIS